MPAEQGSWLSEPEPTATQGESSITFNIKDHDGFRLQSNL